MSPSLRYKGNLQILDDYEAARNMNHLYWTCKIIQEREAKQFIEFPRVKGSNGCHDGKELKKQIYDRSVAKGDLPYDV